MPVQHAYSETPSLSPAANLPDELPEGYYLDNFEFLLSFVVERYHDLLVEEERDYCRAFQNLPLDAKKLYVRLTNRKGAFFRVDKLGYAEVADLPAAISVLSEQGLLGESLPPCETAIALCTRAELLNLDVFSDMPAGTKRSDLIELLDVETSPNPLAELGFPVVEVLGLEHLMIFKLLFFGNFHQDMTEFVMHELIAPFESYDLSAQASAFRTRAAIEQAVVLKVCSDLSRELIELVVSETDILDFVESLPARPEDRLLARRYDKIINRLGRYLERMEAEPSALHVYQLGCATPARERQARLLAKLSRPDEAMRLCETIHAQPRDEAEREFALGFGGRLSRKHKLDTSLPSPGNKSVSQDLVQVDRKHDRVELCAAQHFSAEGICYYVENALFRSLFGLMFWDIIYAPIPGVFFHPFQRGPDDLFTEDFVGARQSMIDQRLIEIESGLVNEYVWRVFTEKAGIANSFVHWGALDTDLLELALDRIPATDLGAVFRRMLIDLRNNTSGFPDLILFTDTGYRLIEIKGPGDKIQKNQARWFRFFEKHGLPARLVNVEYR